MLSQISTSVNPIHVQSMKFVWMETTHTRVSVHRATSDRDVLVCSNKILMETSSSEVVLDRFFSRSTKIVFVTNFFMS